jgi:uncharacterized protein (DUF1015 family)
LPEGAPRFRFMARIAPFCAWRYNPEKIPELYRVTSPPYDVIDRKQQEQLHKRHPLNVVRLELGEELPGDNEKHNRYTRAAGFLKKWRRDRVLVRDPRPSVYLYQHRFQGLNGERITRKGLVVLLYLEPLGGGVVFPHEETFPKHKKDRLELLRACKAQFNPVFSIFPDPNGEVAKLLEPPRPDPDLLVSDEQGVDHLVWGLDDPRFIRDLVEAMAPKAVFIADGHHRYETSLRFQSEQKGQEDPRSPANWTLMYLSPMEDPGLIVFPTHKLVRGLRDFSPKDFLKDLERDFHLEELPFFSHGEPQARRELAARMKRWALESLPIGLALPGEESYWIIRPKDISKIESFLGHLEQPLRRLDVTLLHELILKNRMGIDIGRQGQSHLLFSHELEEALDMAFSKKVQAAFLMNPIPIQTLKQVAAAKCKMPQKATYFYPKLLSGLLIRTMDTQESYIS